MYYEELFYQMGCQNGSNSIEKQLVELKQKKKMVPPVKWSRAKQGLIKKTNYIARLKTARLIY
jgi:hypothetical protein